MSFERKDRSVSNIKQSEEPRRAAADYWRETADGRIELIAGRCRACGTHHLPRVPICASCFGEDLEMVALGGSGRLYTFTVIRVPPTGYASEYAVGYVDFPEGVRVFGQVRLDAKVPLASDMPVTVEKAVLSRHADGSPITGYRFVPSVPELRR